MGMDSDKNNVYRQRRHKIYWKHLRFVVVMLRKRKESP